MGHDSFRATRNAMKPVWIIDDDRSIRWVFEKALTRENISFKTFSSAQEALAALNSETPQVVVSDIRMPGESGLELLRQAKALHANLPVIIMTAYSDLESAVSAFQGGAYEYLPKPFDVDYAVELIRRAMQESIRQENGVQPSEEGPDILGQAPAMQEVFRAIGRLAQSQATVLITGESGTGKELVARALQATSTRSGGAFVPVDCGALPETIIESELFGHERGAFTGALGATGLFRMANHGTLFLDEIGELPLGVQAKLLRALQHKEVRPVGSASAVPVDLRVIAATHRDLPQMVAEGRFRADLFYRLDVVRIEIPPLRDRREDVPLLVHHFLRKHAGSQGRVTGIEDAALELLAEAEWPGNVRELENAVESALALAPGPLLRAADLAVARRWAPAAAAPPADLPLSLDAYERCALERALRETGGDATAAARLLGIGRSTFYRRLAHHGIPPRGGAGGREAIG
jgi:two-component system nitrogen regulation response regulator GlnG